GVLPRPGVLPLAEAAAVTGTAPADVVRADAGGVARAVGDRDEGALDRDRHRGDGHRGRRRLTVRDRATDAVAAGRVRVEVADVEVRRREPGRHVGVVDLVPD